MGCFDFPAFAVFPEKSRDKTRRNRLNCQLRLLLAGHTRGGWGRAAGHGDNPLLAKSFQLEQEKLRQKLHKNAP
jgi:hypothetical protein